MGKDPELWNASISPAGKDIRRQLGLPAGGLRDPLGQSKFWRGTGSRGILFFGPPAMDKQHHARTTGAVPPYMHTEHLAHMNSQKSFKALASGMAADQPLSLANTGRCFCIYILDSFSGFRFFLW